MRHILVALALVAASAAQTPAPDPDFRLFFLGHEIGRETVAWTDAGHFDSTFHFEDRGTAIDLTASFDSDAHGSSVTTRRQGRNYRLFSSDSEVTITADRAHVRDFKVERDVDLRGRPVLSGRQLRAGCRPGGADSVLAGPRSPSRDRCRAIGTLIRIASRGVEALGSRSVERLAIDGVVWGTETAWITVPTRETAVSLVALTTWAGALPFQAVAVGWEGSLDRLTARAAQDRLDDLRRQVRSIVPVETGSFALVNARVVQGTAAPPIEQGTVVIRDGRIVAVGRPPHDISAGWH
jgi:hypothetical protein